MCQINCMQFSRIQYKIIQRYTKFVLDMDTKNVNEDLERLENLGVSSDKYGVMMMKILLFMETRHSVTILYWK